MVARNPFEHFSEGLKCCGNCDNFTLDFCGRFLLVKKYDNVCQHWTWDGITKEDRYVY